ncbi:hypothetical protein [Amycolatopsis sp. NPDC004079]|uniref:hypothetical protein n=1 Tax=Amycolatopsis sp. NPDC004079 TaxID=3154549 RepID=UPI00339E410B
MPAARPTPEGREWSAVRITDGFTEPVDPGSTAGEPQPAGIERAEARLAYVEVTQHRPAPGGLSWINQSPDSVAAGAVR